MALDFLGDLSRDMWNLKRESLEPLVNISETDDLLVVEVDLPLVRKTDIKLRLVEKGLEVEASLTRCIKFEHWGTIQSSCEFKSLYKLIPLPSPISIEEAKATFKRGILRVEINKRRKVEYKIPIT